ncbi:MAG: hypothetical protein C5S47_04990 [Candidatus Methanogasteraceae archaeon]|nr:MAG: hypothetical protein C5S47_04990 [ANME-2 cluster archaeon]
MQAFFALSVARPKMVAATKTRTVKRLYWYSPIETAQYETLINLLNTFSEQVATRAVKGAKTYDIRQSVISGQTRKVPTVQHQR